MAVLGCSFVRRPWVSLPLELCAERVGFEPTVPFRVQQFSRLSYSTTLAPLRIGLKEFVGNLILLYNKVKYIFRKVLHLWKKKTEGVFR